MPERSEPALQVRVAQWITNEGSEEAARRFAGRVLDTLAEMGADPTEPTGKKDFEQMKARLRRADLTPARMERALRDARQAEEEGMSALRYFWSVQRRAYSEGVADKTLRVVRAWLKEDPGLNNTDFQEPPSPEQVLAFRLVWEELGGTSGLAALRELRRRTGGALPQN
jgi:hypothetical protein